MVLDEQGVGLRATWHPERGLVNLSLWKVDRCVETFHLTPQSAGDLMAFIMRALASSVPGPSHPSLRIVGQDDPTTHSESRRPVSRVRERVAAGLSSIAERIRP